MKATFCSSHQPCRRRLTTNCKQQQQRHLHLSMTYKSMLLSKADHPICVEYARVQIVIAYDGDAQDVSAVELCRNQKKRRFFDRVISCYLWPRLNRLNRRYSLRSLLNPQRPKERFELPYEEMANILASKESLSRLSWSQSSAGATCEGPGATCGESRHASLRAGGPGRVCGTL